MAPYVMETGFERDSRGDRGCGETFDPDPPVPRRGTPYVASFPPPNFHLFRPLTPHHRRSLSGAEKWEFHLFCCWGFV